MKKDILNDEEIGRALNRMAHEILEKNRGSRNLAFVGLQTRGVFLAQRISDRILEIEKAALPVGVIDITLYRDDISTGWTDHEVKKTEISFPIGQKKVVLVDDVLFTGRSIRAAIDGLMDYGRPKSIQLAVLIDRGHRELPIQPDFIGKSISTTKSEMVRVKLHEEDGYDSVFTEKDT